MASAKVDRLNRTVTQLDVCLLSADPFSKKSGGLEKEKNLCGDIREIIVCSDFNLVYKEDSRYSDQVNRAVQVVFRLINHSDQSIRAYAEESLDAILRSLLLGFHQYRVLVCLISEISRNGPARSLVFAYVRLAHLVHLSKPNRIISYGLHIVNALGVMLKRPEEAVQQAIIQQTPTIFAAIGPRLRDQHSEKIFQLYQIAADNLDIAGTSNRAAVTVISQICLYYNSILQKAFVRCLMNVRTPDEVERRSRLVGSLNTLKAIWPLVVQNRKLFTPDNLKMCLCSVSCCLHSKQSEVLVSTMELLEVAFSVPLDFMDTFDPTTLGDILMLDNRFISLDRMSLNSSRQESEAPSLRSSPMGSVLDISNLDTSLQPFNTPLYLPDSSPDADNDSDDTETHDDEEIIDPLMHSELYEEFNREITPPPIASKADQESPSEDISIPSYPPAGFCLEGANYYVYIAATLGHKFLLAGLKGLKNDREVRISHKILAMNCLASIAKQYDISEVFVLYDTCQQPLTDVTRFVLHEDDQLCAVTVNFLFSIDKWHPNLQGSNVHFMKVIGSFQPIRKRAVLTAATGEQTQLQALGILSDVLDLVVAEVHSSFFLIQVSCAEFLASLQWFALADDLKFEWQLKCLKAFFDLLFSDDHKVSHVATALLPQLVRNADLTSFTSAFEPGMPEEPLMNSGLIPAVLNLSPEYRFFNESPNYVIESNLEIVLHELCHSLSDGYERRTVAYCRSLEVLLIAFPPTIYYETWGCTSKLPSTSSGFLSTVIDMCELSLMTPSSLAHGLNVIGKLFAGHCEGHMISTVREQSIVDRTTLPRLPEPPVLDRVLLLSLRAINMYYSLIAEHRSTTTQASTSILNRPTMSPRIPRKPSPSRIADISRLLGTTIHPSRPTSFLDSPTIAHLFPHIQGSYTNYLEGVGADKEQKFATLLQSAMDCLGCVCEMLTFAQLRPLLDEILLYIKVVLEVSPESASKLLHQMFKVVFGKNAANINLNCLNSLKMKDPVPPTGDAEMYFLRYANEFTVFSTIIKRREYISNYINRELGWLKNDMLSRIHVPSQPEIATALELFEGFVTQLRQIYNSYQSVTFKKSVLGVMCELPRNGIIYNMADPKKIMLDLVISQTRDPTVGNMELLTEIVLFLVVLARTQVLKFEHIIKVGSDLLENTNERNAPFVLKSIRVLFLELLYVQQIDVDTLYTTFQARSSELMKYSADETLLIWLLILHHSRDNEQRWYPVSIDFFDCFTEFAISKETDFNCSFTIATATLCTMSPSIFRPVDKFFQVLQYFMNDKDTGVPSWSKVAIFVFVLLNCLEEEPLFMRLETLIEQPLQWLTTRICTLIEVGLNSSICSSSSCNSFLHYLQSLVAVFKTNRFNLLKQSVAESLCTLNISPDASSQSGKICSQWLQLLSFSKSGKEKTSQIVKVCPNNSHMSRMANLFVEQKPGKSKELEVASHENILQWESAEVWRVKDEDLVRQIFEDERSCAITDNYFPLLFLDCRVIFEAYESVPPMSRRVFLVNFFTEIEKYLASLSGLEETNRVALAECQERVDVFRDILDIRENSPPEDVFNLLYVLNIFDRIVSMQRTFTWSGIDGVALLVILRTVAANWNQVDSAVFGGLAYLFQASSVKACFADHPLLHLQFVGDIMANVSASLAEVSPITRDKISSSGRVTITGNDHPVFKSAFEIATPEGFFGELFDNCQYIIECVQNGVSVVSLNESRFLRVLLRHPFIHPMAIVPLKALRMNWDLRIDLKSTATPTIHVPLVNIHMLGNMDVLNDFSWRINWIGWISRQQFEDYWMSLFGVLSSTPTGAEISTENSNVTEQILASSDAVSALTDILLYTLLFPEPGNVPCGSFVAKHREKTELFHKSKAFKQLRMYSGKLQAETATGVLFAQNLERLQNNGDYYHLGQLCAMSLWTLTGVLNSTKNGSPDETNVRVSLSEYLLKTTGELDTASSVRALFENYSHWFSRGLQSLPLPLLSATVRSMVFLSDLFDETQSYVFLYDQLKNVYRGGFLANHADFGFVIYGLLKATTVIGIEVVERSMTEADVSKQVLTWVESGLTSRFSFVRSATLHGIHYILQSMSLESLKPVFLYVSSVLLSEINDHTVVGDPIAIPDVVSAADYRKLVWSVAFRIMEEPMQVNFKNSLNKEICKVYTAGSISPSLLSIITAGVEGLILHSATYIPQFLEVVSQCFKDYSSMNHVFPFALRFFVACVFREDIGPRSTAAGKFVIPLEELLSLYRRCDVRDGASISAVLPAILLKLQTEEQAFSTMFDLLEGHSLYCNRKSTLCMIHEFLQRLRESKNAALLHEYCVFARRKAVTLMKLGHSYNYVATCLFIAAGDDNLSSRFLFALNLLNGADCSAVLDDLVSKYQDLQ